MNDKRFKINIMIQLVIVTVVMVIGVQIGVENNLLEHKDQTDNTTQCNNIYVNYDNVTTLSGQSSKTEFISAEVSTEDDNKSEDNSEAECETKMWNDEESYMLAKIAMAEAEGCNIYTKVLVIESVLNRVYANEFPNSIESVLFEQHNGIYQYSTVAPGGRWHTTEPNSDCYKAVEMVKDGIDSSNGALYFESCSNTDNWHSRNLEYLYESDGLRFYK